MRNTRRPWLIAVALLCIAAMASSCSQESKPGAIYVLKANIDVGPVMESFLDRGIGNAEKHDGKAVIIELDTPGGLDSSMRAIVKRIEQAKVPIVVYVYPPGGRAASAGTFITMAANIAVMAPNTAIGAASAVNADGSDIGGTLGKKVENDAVAFIRGTAELRGRNADWAEKAVRDAISSNATDAVNQHVVDFIATDQQDLINKLDGRRTQTGVGQPVTLEGLQSAPIVETGLTPWEKFVDFLADPSLASILLTIGFFGIIFELASPGLVFPGVIGAIAMTLGFIGFGTLPVDTAGLVLIGMGLVFFALELFLPTYGVLGAGGAIAIVVGAIIAFRDTPSDLQPSRVLLAILGIIIVGFFVTMAGLIVQVRKKVATTGTLALVGKVAVARTPLTPEGYVFVSGERWQAQMEDGTARQGDRVRIVGAEGFRLQVRKEDQE